MPWPTRYPAPAFVAVAPLTLLPLHAASTLFTFVSAGLLAYGATAASWHRLPAFPSIAFFTSAQLGQWSILFSAALFLPALSFLAIVKPQTSFPVLASATRRLSLMPAVLGASALIVLSYLLLPGWTERWLDVVRASDNFRIPIAQFGGPLIAVVLLRWKRAEAWLVLVAACMPQTMNPYNALVLIFVATTYREASVLSLISSVAWLGGAVVLAEGGAGFSKQQVLTAVMLGGCYFPAAIAVLRRPNAEPSPWWLREFSPLVRRLILSRSGR